MTTPVVNDRDIYYTQDGDDRVSDDDGSPLQYSSSSQKQHAKR